MSTTIVGRAALVTGANRGIGRRFVDELLERGASKVYATARRPEDADAGLRDDPRVELLALDITDPASVAAVAEQASDVSVLVDNTGIFTSQPLLDGDLATIRLEMETHYFGTLAMARAFAPGLTRHSGSAMINILSALSWFSYPGAGAYAAAEAAEWSLTNTLRMELAPSGVLVQGVHFGVADTDISAGYEGPKIEPIEVARAALDGIEKGQVEVLVDDGRLPSPANPTRSCSCSSADPPPGWAAPPGGDSAGRSEELAGGQGQLPHPDPGGVPGGVDDRGGRAAMPISPMPRPPKPYPRLIGPLEGPAKVR